MRVVKHWNMLSRDCVMCSPGDLQLDKALSN